ncbi:MAG TPA: UDP-N-acetylglucosamine 2-epimerase (non-hydrolyzing) [candidate division Zixibacteria bacterium]|nr:UDP-N-acetylglucosamine 2-epimerase (non-hydrolyzing) [candidate division Zixibacteria bacterium]HBZ00263.1 UDP-N-acetylglucosamine 2-epimerase (non-hydrolyzing) [candidate division Zixibacteria bacterium]
MKKAALVVGARPQFIKTAPLILELGRFFKMVLIHTGQHYDFMMSENFFDELAIPDPDYHLEASGKTPGKQLGRMIQGLEAAFATEKPDLAIVVGDTNSTLAGAITAVKFGLPLAHVEAGVRSKSKTLPEQINRLVTDSITDYFLSPTPLSVENLKREGKTEHLYDTGDVIYDCLRLSENRIPKMPESLRSLPARFILATIHRAEAVDNVENLTNILHSFGTASTPVILPVHPRTMKMLKTFDLVGTLPGNLILIDPLGYLDILSLVRRSYLVVTDSGGVQREAIYLGKPVIVARPETEWVEFEHLGWLKVAGYRFDLTEKFETPGFKSAELMHLLRPAAAGMAEILRNL